MKLSFQLILLSLTKFELYRAEFSCDEIFPAGVKEKISLSCREYLQNIDFDSSDNSSENKQVNDDGEGNGDEGNGDEGNGDEGVDPVGSDGDLSSCFLVDGLPLSNYAGNGLYCSFNKVDKIEDGTAPSLPYHHYVFVSTVKSLRYEIRISNLNVNSWVLVKVEKDMKANRWIGSPIYQAKVTEHNKNGKKMPVTEWIAVKTTDRRESGYEYDKSDPILSVLEIPASSLNPLHLAKLQGYDSVIRANPEPEKNNRPTAKDDLVKLCSSSLCENTIERMWSESDSTNGSDRDNFSSDNLSCKHYHKMAAQLAELSHNFTKAFKHYDMAKDCLLDSIGADQAASRYSRWEVSNLNYDLARQLCKIGDLTRCKDAVTQALANCPDESFRRQLYLDHGSLSLASADFELANQAFVAGRDSVKTLGGRVDLRGFENPTAVSPSSVSAVLINALPHHFSKARNMMLMDLDNGEDWEVAKKQWIAEVNVRERRTLIESQGAKVLESWDDQTDSELASELRAFATHVETNIRNEL